MPQVFVSYSSTDRALARRVARRLRHCGADVFLDETGLEVGQFLSETFQARIQDSSHLVVIWTTAAAASPWVRREVEFALAAQKPAPVVIPLLAIPVDPGSPIAEIKGIELQPFYRFELAFEALRHAIGGDTAPEPSLAQLSNDLSRVLDETPSLARVLRNPLVQAPLTEVERLVRHWDPQSVSTFGLPSAGDPDYHALDFALWCAMRSLLIALRDRPSMAPTEVVAYPGILVSVLAATQAGSDALAELLATHPGLVAEAMKAIVEPRRVADASLSLVVELFRRVFTACLDGQLIPPHGSASSFLLANLERLAAADKAVFFEVVRDERGPTFGSMGMLQGLRAEDSFMAPVNELMQQWLEYGLFDRSDPTNRSLPPVDFWRFVAGWSREAKSAVADQLLARGQQRMRDLFRSCTAKDHVAALRWLADAGALPADLRHVAMSGWKDGVISSEFESCQDSAFIGPLARQLAESLMIMDPNGVDCAVRREVQIALEQAGFPVGF